MELVRFSRNMQLPLSPKLVLHINKGDGYIMAQQFANQIKDTFGGNCIELMQNFESIYGFKKYNGEDLNGKKLVVWRTGGAGDLLFLSPSLKKIKELYPKSEIALGTSARYMNIFDNFPYIDARCPLPLPEKLIQEADYYCIFEGMIEANKAAETINAYDLFAERLHVLDKMTNKEKKPILVVGKDDEAWAESFLLKHRGASAMVGFQLSASAVIRTYNAATLRDIATYLAQHNIVSFFFGSEHDIPAIDLLLQTAGHPENLVNVAQSKPSWLQSAAVLKRMHLMVTPDSSLSHFAAALGVPLLGIFGPFHSDVRFKYYPNAVAIDANASCKSCFQHGSLPCRYVQPGQQDMISKCFDCVQIDIVLETIREILKSKYSGINV